MHTPWGPSQIVEQVAPGIQFVSTAGHGGFKLEPMLNAQVPKRIRNRGGWYEEDCEWAKLVIVFPDLLEATADTNFGGITEWEALVQMAINVLLEYIPDAYEYLFDESLMPGDSWKWDKDRGLI